MVVSGFFLANGKASAARLLAAKLHDAGICVCVIDRCNYNKKGLKCSFEEVDIPSIPKRY